LRSAAGLAAGGAAWYALGCGGSDGNGEPTRAATAAGGAATPSAAITPVLLASEHVVGLDNRFLVGLLEDAGGLVRGANVHARYFTLAEDGRTGTLRGEGDMQYVELAVEGAHSHDGSTGAALDEDLVGFYLHRVPFDSPGRWAAEIIVERDGVAPQSLQVPFEVLAESKSPPVGAPAPASQNDTAATNPNDASLCSRDPICGLHDIVIADALAARRPLAVMFSTPAFCETRFCGPVLELLLERVPAYRDRIDFVHIEVWRDFQTRTYRETMREWNLPTEPYTFFVDPAGNIAGRLEAIFSNEEMDIALERLAAL
jgi:hypothetical protein